MSRLRDEHSENLGIPSDIDPEDALRRFEGGKYNLFYGPDNKVRYFKRDINGKGKRYV